jgi:ATP/maltotriose-dependent transcriptional regulator MalT
MRVALGGSRGAPVRKNPPEPVSTEELSRGREAYARRAWAEAYASLSRADAALPLGGADLGMLATAAFMVGREDDSIAVLERAHHALREEGDPRAAVLAAFWIGMQLMLRGDVGPGTGWLARADRLLGEDTEESVERGYLLLPQVFRHAAEGELERALALAREAVAIGERRGDRDLFALAVHEQGILLVEAGRLDEGLPLLDEAMVAATAGELSPIVTGVVYCAVILACQGIFEVRRAREWTNALSRWCAEQPELLAFTGRCLVHRAEILQLDGSWGEALVEAERAAHRSVETGSRAGGLAHYRRGELLRLAGDFDAAEEAYREAGRLGWEPQPGIAQLRLAQGRAEAAAASVRRADAETTEPLRRAALLPAYVEIMLAVDDVEDAARACAELEEVAGRYDSAMLTALLAHARGAVALAQDDPRGALVALRAAAEAWQALAAPYESARTRVLVALACRALGDEEAAARDLEAARAAFEELGAGPDAARVDALDGRGETHGLSGRELEVLRLVAAGKSNREIAGELVISEHTVARHLQNIFAKLRLSSRTAAAAFAFEHDLA